MKKHTKSLVILLLATIFALSAIVFAACKGNTPDNGNNNNGGDQGSTKTKYTVTYDANGGAFADGNTFTQQVEEGSKLTAPTSPTRGNYTFVGWAKNKSGSNMWKFDEDTVTENTTLYAQWTQESAVIFSVDGASMDGTSIYMFVTHDVDSVSLSGKVVCSEDSIWKLYYDRMGQTEIPTKVAVGMSGHLMNGENEFYIVVTSQNGSQVRLYELTVYRSFAVSVNYYDGAELLKTDTTYTGFAYTANYNPSITGYTFNGWKTSSGKTFTSETIWGTTSLYTDKTANTYTANLDVNGGDTLEENTETMTYGSTYTLPVPTRAGYSFTGWYVGNTQITDSNGRSLVDWNYASATTVTAHWEAKEYLLTLFANNSSAGTVTGGGIYAYDSKVTIIATTNTGYTWVGWYQGDTKISDELIYTFTMAASVNYTAHWSKVTVEYDATRGSVVDVASSSSSAVLKGKYKVGDEVTVKAVGLNKQTSTSCANSVFIGWFKGNELFSSDIELTITMTADDVTYTAKWCIITIKLSDSKAGSVDTFSDFKVGDNLPLNATTTDGYTFVGWYLDDGFISAEQNTEYLLESSQDLTFNAVWTFYTLTTTYKNVNGGTYTFYGQKKITAGESVTLTATIKAGYTWLGWYKGDELVSRDLEYEFEMPRESLLLAAYWIKCPVKLEKNVNLAGSVSGLEAGTIVGEETTITANTNSGYTWIGWFDGDVKLTSDYSYTFAMTSEEKTFTAKWCKVNVTSGNASAGKVDSLSGKYRANEKISVTAISLGVLGYEFDGWYKGDEKLTDSLTFTFNMPSEDTTYVAKWKAVAEMSNFKFTSTADTCTITGIIDEAVTEIVVPNYVTAITASSFSKCTSLIRITIPFVGTKNDGTGSTHFGYIFGGNKGASVPQSLREVVVTGGDTIYENAFNNCRNLTSITIPNSITSIGAYAFYLCKAMKSFTIPESVTTIGQDAFSNCSLLQSVNIPSNVTVISNYAFAYCYNLLSITIPEGVTTIGNGAFLNSGLTSITIPSSVTLIDSRAFTDCYKLVEVWNNSQLNVMKGHLTHGSVAFYSLYVYSNGEQGRQTEKDGFLFISTENGDYLLGYGGSATDLTLPECSPNGNTYGIYEYTFYYSDITGLVIPQSVTSIRSHAIYGCDSLVSITIPFVGETIEETDNSYFGYIFGASSSTNQSNSVRSTLKEVVITGGTVLPGYAFYGCSYLTSITLPDTLTVIAGSAFMNCSSLTSITLPEGITNLGTSTFYGCASLKSIKIPEGVKSIGDGLFKDCKNLVSIELPQNLVTIGSNAFSGCVSLSTITIPQNVTLIDSRAFYDCTALESVTIGGSVKSIRENAFRNCSSLVSITIPESVVEIGADAFAGCYALAEVTFEKTEGWWYSNNASATSGTSINPDVLENIETAARYLRITYGNYYWKRS